MTPEDPSLSASPAGAAAQTNRRRVLIIEDELVFALELQARLEDMGHQVVGTADNGIDGIRLARDRRPDLVLLDIVLNGFMDGVSTGRVLAQLDLPMIFLSGHGDHLTVGRAAQLSPHAYLTKPLHGEKLARAIDTCPPRPAHGESGAT